MLRLLSLILALICFGLGAFETFMFDMDWFNQAMAGLFFFALSFLPFLGEWGGPVIVTRRREQ